MGPAHRRRRAVAPARGSRRRAGAAAGPVPRRTGSSSPGCVGRDRATRPGSSGSAGPGRRARMSIGAGDRLTVDEVAMRVLWPVRGQVPAEPPDAGSGINNVSVVLLGVIGERRFLLTGDVEEDVDPSLLTGGLPRVDLLKVAHHGSRTATTDAFVAAVRPRVAVASAGADNPYGHPGPSDAGASRRVRRAGLSDRCRRSVTVTFGAGGSGRPHGAAACGGRRIAHSRGRATASGRGDGRRAAAQLLLCDPRDQGPGESEDPAGRLPRARRRYERPSDIGHRQEPHRHDRVHRAQRRTHQHGRAVQAQGGQQRHALAVQEQYDDDPDKIVRARTAWRNTSRHQDPDDRARTGGSTSAPWIRSLVGSPTSV